MQTFYKIVLSISGGRHLDLVTRGHLGDSVTSWASPQGTHLSSLHTPRACTPLVRTCSGICLLPVPGAPGQVPACLSLSLSQDPGLYPATAGTQNLLNVFIMSKTFCTMSVISKKPAIAWPDEAVSGSDLTLCKAPAECLNKEQQAPACTL